VDRSAGALERLSVGRDSERFGERKVDSALGVSTDQVGSLTEASDRGLVTEGRVSAVMVVVPKPAVKGSGPFGGYYGR
jgi:hypothetical protein